MINTEQRQMAADLWTKPTSLSRKSFFRQLVNHTHHLLFISPTAGYSCYHPVEGRRLSPPGWLWLHTDMSRCRLCAPVYPSNCIVCLWLYIFIMKSYSKTDKNKRNYIGQYLYFDAEVCIYYFARPR